MSSSSSSILKSKAASTIAFDGIAGANKLNLLINEQIEKASEAKMMKQAELMAKAFNK